MRRKLGLVVLLACANTACRSETPAGFGPTTEPEDPAPVEGTSEDPRAIALGPLTLGWDAVPNLPRANAVADNRSGVVALDDSDFEGALAAFDRALDQDPDYAWARYGRARALAGLGREVEAFAELAILLQTDLPRFGPRVGTDEAFASVREGELGELLEALHTRVREAYVAAVERGAIGWVYQPRAMLNPRTQQPHAPYENLRMVIYVDGRVLPLSPDQPLALGGMIDREAGRLLILSGQIVMGDMWVVQPRAVGVQLYDLEGLGLPIIDRTKVDERRDPTKGFRTAIVATIEGDAVRLGYLNPGYAPGELVTRMTAKKLEVVARTEEIEQPDGAYLTIDGHGVQLHQFVDGFWISGRWFHVEGRAKPIELDPAHGLRTASVRIEASQDRQQLMILSQSAECGEDGAARRHALSRVDLGEGRATLLATGEGMAGASMSGDGTIYFEAPGSVARFEPGGSRALEDLPERLHFALPGYAYDCSI